MLGFFSSLFGGGQASAIKKAAELQKRTADENRKLAEEYTGQSLTDLDAALAAALGETDAYTGAGSRATNALESALGLRGPEEAQSVLAAIQGSPAYQFNLQQGEQALNRGMNARGRYYSGGALKGLTEFGQGLATNYLENALDRITGLSNTGANVAGHRAGLQYGAGQDRGNIRGSALNAITGFNTAGSEALGAGYIGAAQARSNALSNILSGVAGVAGSALGGPLGGTLGDRLFGNRLSAMPSYNPNALFGVY